MSYLTFASSRSATRRPTLLMLAGLTAFASITFAADRHVVIVSVDGLAATYFDDPKAPLPTLRQLAAHGAHARGMVTAFPSVTWPAHVSLVTGAWPGRHGIIGNSVLNRKNGELITYIGDPVFTKDQCVKVPTLYDAVHAAGGEAGAVIWPACNGANSLTWTIPDSNLQSIHDRYTKPAAFGKELADANLSISKLGTWGWDHKFSAMRDATYAQVAVYLLKKYQPELLLVHFITPDGFEHDYGPACEEAYWACGDADLRLREIWEALQEPGLKDKSTLLVVSDHGFAEYTQLIQPNVLFKEMGLIEVDAAGRVVRRSVWSHAHGGSASIYILDESRREELAEKVTAALSALPGVDRVLDAGDFIQLGLPDPRENPEQSELMVSARPGYSFNNDHKSSNVVIPSDGRRGSHGHLPAQRFMHATFVAAGAGIKPGSRLDEIQCIDVAPTAARLLDVPFPSADGRVLTEFLVDP